MARGVSGSVHGCVERYPRGEEPWINISISCGNNKSSDNSRYK